MTYSIEQVQRGLLRYVDTEMVSKVVGIQKWAVGGVCALYAAKLNDIADKLRQNPAVAILDVLPDSGGVDIEALYSALYPQAERSAATVDLPIIGTITINATDLEKLYNCIRNS